MRAIVVVTATRVSTSPPLSASLRFLFPLAFPLLLHSLLFHILFFATTILITLVVVVVVVVFDSQMMRLFRLFFSSFAALETQVEFARKIIAVGTIGQILLSSQFQDFSGLLGCTGLLRRITLGLIVVTGIRVVSVMLCVC